MERKTSKLAGAFVVLLLVVAAATTAISQEEPKVIDMNALAARGEAIANADPLSAELRDRQPDDPSRRGFDIGMAAAEGHTLPGPGKQRIHDSLPATEQRGFNIAVSFSLERNRNVDFAARGAAIAKVDEKVAAARTAETDVFYWLGFDIATGIFGDSALGAQGNTAVGPGSLKIRDSLSPAGQRGFNASVKFHLGQDAPPSSSPERRPRTPGEVTSIDNFGKRDTALDKAYGDLSNVRADQVVKVGKDSGAAAFILANLPFIDDVRVRPDTRDVIISFTSTQKASPLIEIGKVAPAPDQHGILAFPSGSGAFSRFVPGQNGQYSLNLGTLNEQLDIGTTYYYIINVFNDDKNNTKRPREQVTGKFTTLPQTVKVIFTEIAIAPILVAPVYSDYVFTFDVNVPDQAELNRLRDNWTLAHFFDFNAGEFQIPGRTLLGRKLVWGANPIQKEILIENAPDDLAMVVAGEVPNLSIKEKSQYRNSAKGHFDLSAYRLGPGDSMSIPFTLTSRPLQGGSLPGRLAFEIKGRIEVTRH